MPERRKVAREQHDAFENDIGLDLGSLATEVSGEVVPTASAAPPQAEAIERVGASQIRPDRFQPRPVLPVEIQSRFFDGKIDWRQAARDWLALAETEPGHSARVRELVAMAETIDEHGQIKPITGSWVEGASGGFLFLIETGERRFWGVCLRHVAEGRKGEPSLRVEAVSRPSLQRQILENRHAEPPSAVAQAREIGALVLNSLEVRADSGLRDPYDFFRQAIQLPDRQRLPRGIWPKLEELMQLSSRRMHQLLAILEMPTALLEKADRYNLSYSVLEAVLQAPANQRKALIDQAVEQSLTAEQVEQVAAAGPKTVGGPAAPPPKKDPVRSALRGLRGFANSFQKVNARTRERMLDDMADELYVAGRDEVEAVVELLDRLGKRLRTRLRAKN
jgi:hypothetical protein